MNKSIKLTQNGGEWLLERNGQSPEKLGADPQVARDQIMQFVDELLPDQHPQDREVNGMEEQFPGYEPKPVAGDPAKPKTPADDHETTPTKSAKSPPPQQTNHSTTAAGTSRIAKGFIA